MNCPRCNANNKAEAGFCEECGMTLTLPQTEVFGEPVYQDAQLPQVTPPVTYGYPVYNTNYAAPYQDPGYNPYDANQFNPNTAWTAIVGLVIGIISMPLCFCGLGFTMTISDEAVALSFVLNLLLACSGVVFSIIGMKSTKRGMAIAGLVCSIVSIIAALFFFIAALAALYN